MSQQAYTSDIVRLIEQQGRDAAAAADRKGQIWGGALANLGQIPAQIQQQKAQQQRQQLQQQEVSLRGQELDQRTKQFAQELADKKQKHDDDAIAQVGSFIHESGNTIEGLQSGLAALQKAGLLSDAEAQPILAGAQQDPSRVKLLARGMMSRTPEGRNRLEKVTVYKPGEVGRRDFDNTEVFTAPPEAPKNATELAMAAQDPALPPTERAKGALAAVQAPTLAARDETARHNAELERIAGLTQGRQEAAAGEQARHNQAMEKIGLIRANKPSAAAGGMGPAVELKPESREYHLAQDLAYGKLTMTDFQRLMGRAVSNAGLKLAIYDQARQLNPNFNPAAFEMGFKFASTPKVQQQLTSLDNVLKAVPDMLKASDAADRFGATTLNSYVNPIKVGIGNKAFSNLKTARIAFADELSGALGYGSATDMSREMGFNMTDTNLSPANFRDSLQTIVVPFVERKRQTMLDGMGVYGKEGMNPAADIAAKGKTAAPTKRYNPATGKVEDIKP